MSNLTLFPVSSACAPKHHRRFPKNKNATNNLPPILFHSIHGENVRVNSDRSAAARVNSYCKAIVFSNRPIREKERLYIKFSEISSNWSGALRFGFTSVNPSSFRTSANLPKYVCPDMTNMEPATSWAKALPERLATPDSVLSFYFTTSGRCAMIHFAINGEEKGSFPIGIKDKGENVWALIDIYGNTTSIEFVDPRIPIHNNLQNSVRSQALSRRSQSLGVIGHLSVEDSDDEGMYESMRGLTSYNTTRSANHSRKSIPKLHSRQSTFTEFVAAMSDFLMTGESRSLRVTQYSKLNCFFLLLLGLSRNVMTANIVRDTHSVRSH